MNNHIKTPNEQGEEIAQKIIGLINKEDRFENMLDRIFGFPLRFKYRADSKKYHRKMRRTIEYFTSKLIYYQKSQNNNLVSIHNFALYLCLLKEDLLFFNDDLVFAVGLRRKRFITKHAAILLFESFRDIEYLSGKPLRDVIKHYEIPDLIKTKLNNWGSKFHKLCQRNDAFLGKIRNNISAHRELITLEYIKALDTLIPNDVIKILNEFSNLLQELIDILIGIFKYIAQPEVLLKDFI